MARKIAVDEDGTPMRWRDTLLSNPELDIMAITLIFIAIAVAAWLLG